MPGIRGKTWSWPHAQRRRPCPPQSAPSRWVRSIYVLVHGALSTALGEARAYCTAVSARKVDVATFRIRICS
jgi:hypothetical protein